MSNSVARFSDSHDESEVMRQKACFISGCSGDAAMTMSLV